MHAVGRSTQCGWRGIKRAITAVAKRAALEQPVWLLRLVKNPQSKRIQAGKRLSRSRAVHELVPDCRSQWL